MSKLTEKDVFCLEGQVAAACHIMNNVLQEMCAGRWTDISPEALKAVIQATELSEKLRTALRGVSYEVDHVRKDSRDNK